MLCSNCGSEIPNGIKFCSNCGQPVGGASSAAAQQPVSTAPGQAPDARTVQGASGEAAAKSGGSSKVTTIIGAIVIILVVWFVATNVFGIGKAKTLEQDFKQEQLAQIASNMGIDRDGVSVTGNTITFKMLIPAGTSTSSAKKYLESAEVVSGIQSDLRDYEDQGYKDAKIVFRVYNSKGEFQFNETYTSSGLG